MRAAEHTSLPFTAGLLMPNDAATLNVFGCSTHWHVEEPMPTTAPNATVEKPATEPQPQLQSAPPPQPDENAPETRKDQKLVHQPRTKRLVFDAEIVKEMRQW